LVKYFKLYIGDLKGYNQVVLKNPSGTFGDLNTYVEPSWYQGWNSYYYNDSHKRFRDACRKFVDTEIIPYCHEWSESKKIPKELSAKAAPFLPSVLGHRWPVEYVGTKVYLISI
jgi:hypothetical protein